MLTRPIRRRDTLTLKLAGKSYVVSRDRFCTCKYIRVSLRRGPAPCLDLPWGNVIPIETMDWFVELLQTLTPGEVVIPSWQLCDPEEDRVERIAALARLYKLSILMAYPVLVEAARRTGTELIRRVHVAQDTDTELRKTVRQFDDAYQAWSFLDGFLQHWILAKFCAVVHDVDRAISLLGPLDISNEFREKAMGMQLRKGTRALSLQDEKAVEEDKSVEEDKAAEEKTAVS